MRTCVVGAAMMLAVGSVTMGAQQAAPAPSAPGTVVTSTMRNWGTQYANWLTTAFDSIPADKYGYKPTPVQMSIGQIASHLERSNYLLCSRAGGVTHAMTARDSIPDTVKAGWPKDSLVTRLKASFEFCGRVLATVTDAALPDSLASPNGRKFVRAQYLLVYVTDLVDHYSQIANYMRLNGLVPPSALPRPKS